MVRWVGYSETTEEPRSKLLDGCTPLVRQLVRQACAEAILRGRTHNDEADDMVEDEESDDECGGEDEVTPEDTTNTTFAVRTMDEMISFCMEEMDDIMTEEDCQPMFIFLNAVACSLEPLDTGMA